MSYFFADQNLEVGQDAVIGGEEARHMLQARRIKPGERIKLQGPDGKRFMSEVVAVGKTVVTVRPSGNIQAPDKPAASMTLLQSMVSEQALDIILQKSAELGAENIVLFPSANSPQRFSPEQVGKKLPRWQKILAEATKQCERAEVPGISYLKSLDEALSLARGMDQAVLLDVGGVPPAARMSIDTGKGQTLSFALFVGPEGGFTQLEIEQIKSIPGATSLKLGPYILRAETAAIAGLAVIQNSVR